MLNQKSYETETEGVDSKKREGEEKVKERGQEKDEGRTVRGESQKSRHQVGVECMKKTILTLPLPMAPGPSTPPPVSGVLPW